MSSPQPLLVQWVARRSYDDCETLLVVPAGHTDTGVLIDNTLWAGSGRGQWVESRT